ncbi:uncharacterized protein LOC126799692 [Argentina anserina]|uniref:uncharacterized protein LOC126799692 n=1 Tax=Argentina anserina TaxID=57926 RepID=UPI002176219D|nr:uncharacterized protein LOC126799692 [Potentilla anserina]
MEAEDDEFGTAAAPPPRRSICGNCGRPRRVCLCGSLPAQPIPTRTQVIILHHPHEAQHKLSTTPVLTRCLANSSAIVGRRLRPGLSPLLDQSPSAVYLFPPSKSSPSVSLSGLLESSSPPQVIIAFDATWRHAREMVRASEGFLGGFAARRVSLDLEVDEGVRGGSIYDSELILRKEPCGGCVSTMEAVARALRVVEPNGAEIERRLIAVLRDMVALQAGFLKPVKERVKLLKKGKEEQQRRSKE